MQAVEELLTIAPGDRDECWESRLLRELPEVPVRVLRPEPQQGPDGMPYLLVETTPGADDSMIHVLGWLSERGIGLVFNALKAIPDMVLSYGMIWNFRERGELLSAPSQVPSGSFDIQPGQEVLTGPPSETHLPKYARSILRQFLMDQGFLAPKVLMASFDGGGSYDLCFSIESLKSPDIKEHPAIAEALAWFLPAHYPISLVSEKTLAGFQPL